MEKLKDDQLKMLQDLVGNINNLQIQIGGLELQKHQTLHKISDLQGELSLLQKELEKEYGTVSINLQDGTISKEQEDDEN